MVRIVGRLKKTLKKYDIHFSRAFQINKFYSLINKNMTTIMKLKK